MLIALTSAPVEAQNLYRYVNNDIRKNKQKTNAQLHSLEKLRQRFLSDIERLEQLRGHGVIHTDQPASRIPPTLITGEWRTDTWFNGSGTRMALSDQLSSS